MDDNKLSENILFTFFTNNDDRKQIEDMLNIIDLKIYYDTITNLKTYDSNKSNDSITISEMLDIIKNNALNNTILSIYDENIIKERICVPIMDKKQNYNKKLNISEIIENSFEMKLILLSYIYKKSVVMFVRPKSETYLKMFTKGVTSVFGDNRDILTLKIDGKKNENKNEETIYLYRNIKNINYLLEKKNDTSSSQDPNNPQDSKINGFFEILKTIADATSVLSH